MYPKWEELEEYVHNEKKYLPFFFCEYSHAMMLISVRMEL